MAMQSTDINEYKEKTRDYASKVRDELVRRENNSKVSAREIQRRSGVSHATYDRLINNAEMSFNTIMQLIYYYGLTPAEFFCAVEGKIIADDNIMKKVKEAKRLLDEVL